MARLAGGLRALGLRPNDRVVMVMSDDVEMATTILAAFHAGLIAVPASTMLTSGELEQILRDAGARAVIATREYVDAVLPGVESCSDIENFIVVDADADLMSRPVRAGLRIHLWADLLGDPAGPRPDRT